MKDTIKIGKIGEDIACGYLVKKGWRILRRNHKERSDEIDIISISGDGTLVFCEVKALSLGKDLQLKGLMPEDNLTSAKMRKISRACQLFAGKHPKLIRQDKGWRIDLLAIDINIGIDGSGTARDIRHYENI